MKAVNNMHYFYSIIFLSILLVITSFTTFSINDVEAQSKDIIVKSIGFEKTTVIEFENNAQSEIGTIRMWLGKDDSFKSFKTEKGWTGQKTPQGVLVFTSTELIKIGESVKFGIKTEKSKPGINWKALDENNNQLEIGKTLVTEIPSLPSEDITGPISSDKSTGMFSESTFRLVPEKPNVGSTIRVTGDKLAPNYEFDFYLGTELLHTFETDENGHFIFTTKIPKTQIAERVNFIVRDKAGNEKTLSLRLGEEQNRMTMQQAMRLTISGLPSTINPGEVILISGTGKPGGTVTGTIRGPEGNIITSKSVEIDAKGAWNYQTIVAIDTPLGKYSAEISDGKDTILRHWVVESSKTILIVPSKIKFEPGEVMIFNGTALTDQNIEIILENPQGAEIFSDIVMPDNSGYFEIEFPTERSSPEGTYVLFAFQGEKSEVVYVGLGELPREQLVLKMDKLNYKAGETAIISLSGPPSATLNLLIIDPSDKNKFADSVILTPDGKQNYELDLLGYTSGVYTTVVTRANSQTNEVFSVGLQTGSGPIVVRVTKDTYTPGDPILILGESGQNILITLTLLDPDGNKIKVKEIFTNKEGVLSESSFRIPSSAQTGVWTLKASSGPNLDTVDFDVSISTEEGMIVLVESIENKPPLGRHVNIKVLGAAQNVSIDIISPDGEIIQELHFIASDQGVIALPWQVPIDSVPGVYTIQVDDAFNSASTTFILE